jgi:hypothetical protein
MSLAWQVALVLQGWSLLVLTVMVMNLWELLVVQRVREQVGSW